MQSTSGMHLKKTSPWSWLLDILFLTFFIGILYSIWLGSHPLFTPDEGRYSEVAREMVVTGDYITPRVDGVAFLDKPILYYWLQAAAIHLFGLKEWSLRFFPALIGVFGCIATYIAGRVLLNRRTGVLSSCILATSALYYGGAHYANLDLEVAVFISISLMSFISAIQTEKKFFYFLGYFFSAFAFLTKGLIGLFFPIMVVGAWILLMNRWDVVRKMHLVLGFLLFCMITLPWYVLVQKANPEFLHFFFVTQQVSRFLTTADFNNKTSAWFYVPIVLAGGFPWTLFIFQSITQKIKLIWQNRKIHSTHVFLLLWLVLIFTFFSIPKSKTVGYILPVFPVCALLIGSYFDSLWQARLRLGSYLYVVCCFIVFTATSSLFYIHTPLIQTNLIYYLQLAGFLFFASGCVTLYFLLKRKPLSTMFSLFLTTSVLFLLIIMASTNALNQKTTKPLALLIKPILTSNDEVISYYKYYQDLPIYLERRITIVADWNASDIVQRDNWVREMWYSMPFQDTSAWLINDETFWKKWNSDKRVFVMLNTNYFDSFSEKAKSKIYPVGKFESTLLISNKEFH